MNNCIFRVTHSLPNTFTTKSFYIAAPTRTQAGVRAKEYIPKGGQIVRVNMLSSNPSLEGIRANCINAMSVLEAIQG
ncbi:hypothetical protein D3C74_49710 [compost metagenome]